jgi:Outer membrane protein beta-barrel domain
MKNSNRYLRVKLLLFAVITTGCIMAQKGQSFITFRVPVQYAWYQVDVIVAAERSARGLQRDNSIQVGCQVAYEYFINNKLSAELGLGVGSAVFNIVRGYNTRYMGSLLAYLAPTNPNYKYNLLQLPVRVNYRIKQVKKADCMIGVTNLFNFTWKQHYGRSDKMTQFYFFSNAVQLHARLRYQVGNKIHVSAEPTLQVFNQWKKDEIVYDYGLGFQQPRPEGVDRYNKQFFDAVGIAFALSYKL